MLDRWVDSTAAITLSHTYLLFAPLIILSFIG